MGRPMAGLSNFTGFFYSLINIYFSFLNFIKFFVVFQLPNPQDSVVQQLQAQIQQMEHQIQYGWQAYEGQSQALADAVRVLIGIFRKHVEMGLGSDFIFLRIIIFFYLYLKGR
jgi:hypothetical protein